MYSAYRIAFDGAGSSSFGNDFTWNILNFGVDNCSLSHIVNHKNNFLVLDGGPTDYINGSVAAAEKKFSFSYSKAKAKFCLSLHYNGDNSYLLVNEKETISLNPIIKMSTFQLNFCVASIPNEFDAVESREVSWKGNVSDFLSITMLLINLTY